MGESEVERGAASSELRERVFFRIRPYCLELLEFTRNPRKNASFLREMTDFIRRAPPAGLQPCLEYTLFPLMLLLDAAIQCRSGKKADSSGCFVPSGSPLSVHMISDSVAEDTLRCLEELFRKCHLGSVNQMAVVLKKLTSGALLSPSEVSEEFRIGIIRCLKAMLLMLQPCSIESCSCQEIFLLPTMISTLKDCLPTAFCYEEPEECLLAFLRSKDASVVVGHWLSLLLQVGEVEAARGQRGSVNLRKEAFLTLRVLVAKVGIADALAFFLPGIVSRFSKALLVTKNMISGAAGNAGTVEHAIYGLTEFLIIVLRDEANRSALQASTNEITFIYSDKSSSTQTVLDALRRLPISHHDHLENSICQSTELTPSKDENNEKLHDNYFGTKSLYVQRTKEWLHQTSANVDKLLSATFLHLCVHPSEKVRKAVVDGTIGLLSNCICTLQMSKLMLLECLCTLAVDDSDVVSTAAQDSLDFLFMSGRNFVRETEFSELFTRFVERLPKVLLGSEETVSVSYVRRLLALMYYAGPKLVVDHIFCSPVKAASFVDFLIVAFGHNSQFAGSIDKLISSKPLSIGYLLSVAELKTSSLYRDADLSISDTSSPLISDISSRTPTENMPCDYHFPRMPPWFINVGSQKLYLALAGILRLLGLSIISGNGGDVSLLTLIDNLLEHPRKLISDIRLKGQNKQGWQYLYSQGGLGQLLRQTSVVICMINEIIYGLADHSVSSCLKVFRNSEGEVEVAQAMTYSDDHFVDSNYRLAWKFHEAKDAKEHVIHCVGIILHEYTSPELWDLPVDQNSRQLEHDPEANMSLHFFRDSRMLHQVMIEGIGVFSMVLGKDITRSGFMHSILYLLLQNLICSNDLIRTAADAALHVVSTSTGHSTVGHLVVANADYIIDSLCRELRHLDLNPHVPDVLAAMLSYIGAANEILPLLEEPLQAISSELEVLGRHQHPHLTLPFLKAVNEISSASRCESLKLPNVAEAYNANVMANTSCILDCKESIWKDSSDYNLTDIQLQLEHLVNLEFKLNEMKRYRRTIGSLAASCLKAATPLVCLLMESACLAALDILEDATICLAKVEEAYRSEKESKAAIERAIHLCSFNELADTMNVQDEEVDENRLLPAMNKIWPCLILCVKNRISVAVIRRCTGLISKVVQIAGGDFFVRRFHTDGPIIWKLLNSSPFRRKPFPSKDERPLILPYRSSSLTSEDPMAETSSLKIQVAVLNMIAEIASNKRSSSAFQTVFKKVSGLVVGIACSNVIGLREASTKALSGLASIHPDPIWLFLADVYYSLKNRDIFPVPPTPELATVQQLLPPPLSSNDYLYVQYGGETFGFDVDPSSVEIVFQKLQSEVFE